MIILISKEEQEIYDLTSNLLHAIRKGDVETYKKYTSQKLSCIEPETSGSVVIGLDFHLFFIKNMKLNDYHFEIINPTIRVFSDTAYICYSLLTNTFSDNKFSLKTVFETRIYHKEAGQWKMVHFHRNN